MTFLRHLEVLKNFYRNPRPCGQPKDNKFALMVLAIISCWNWDAQQGLFKLTMNSNVAHAMVEVMALASDKINPTIINPLTCMWRVIHVSQLLSNVFREYLKVVQIAMVHVLGFVDDEQCFNFVAFLNNKVRNRLNNHLQLKVSMYAQKFFTLHNFPYEDTYEMWCNGQSTIGQYA